MGKKKEAKKGMKLVIKELRETVNYHQDCSDMAKALLKAAKKDDLSSKDLREADDTFMGVFELLAEELDNPGKSYLSNLLNLEEEE